MICGNYQIMNERIIHCTILIVIYLKYSLHIITVTNDLNKRTNREAALSDIGEDQVREACKYLKSTGSTPTVVRYR